MTGVQATAVGGLRRDRQRRDQDQKEERQDNRRSNVCNYQGTKASTSHLALNRHFKFHSL